MLSDSVGNKHACSEIGGKSGMGVHGNRGVTFHQCVVNKPLTHHALALLIPENWGGGSGRGDAINEDRVVRGCDETRGFAKQGGQI